jgi:formylglycine-generating enzyme required for sulfatase activity
MTLDVQQAPPQVRSIEIPEGLAKLGLVASERFPFGWDNEFKSHTVEVPRFSIDEYSVTNAQYLQFVRGGGYTARELWSQSGWEWIQHSSTAHPKFWKWQHGEWWYRTMFSEIVLPPAWPVYVSHAEADAYARWAGKSLPTEAQFHRAAYGNADGSESPYPWGSSSPEPGFGNFDFSRWTPTPVDAHPLGNSSYGVSDLVGNGYEWTSTVFRPFPGFEPFSFYPGYSADFFDGQHYVMKGGSPRTAAILLRHSFRNWFQPLYPHIYAKFRCVEN